MGQGRRAGRARAGGSRAPSRDRIRRCGCRRPSPRPARPATGAGPRPPGPGGRPPRPTGTRPVARVRSNWARIRSNELSAISLGRRPSCPPAIRGSPRNQRAHPRPKRIVAGLERPLGCRRGSSRARASSADQNELHTEYWYGRSVPERSVGSVRSSATASSIAARAMPHPAWNGHAAPAGPKRAAAEWVASVSRPRRSACSLCARSVLDPGDPTASSAARPEERRRPRASSIWSARRAPGLVQGFRPGDLDVGKVEAGPWRGRSPGGRPARAAQAARSPGRSHARDGCICGGEQESASRAAMSVSGGQPERVLGQLAGRAGAPRACAAAAAASRAAATLSSGSSVASARWRAFFGGGYEGGEPAVQRPPPGRVWPAVTADRAADG